MKPGYRMVAEIGEGFSFNKGPIATLTLLEQKIEGAGRGLKRGVLVADSVPELLDSAKALYEQEGSWEAVAEKMKAARERDSNLTSRVAHSKEA